MNLPVLFIGETIFNSRFRTGWRTLSARSYKVPNTNQMAPCLRMFKRYLLKAYKYMTDCLGAWI